MPRLTTTCKTCDKEVKSVQSELTIGGQDMVVYQCGHINLKVRLDLDMPESETLTKDNIVDFPAKTSLEEQTESSENLKNTGSFKASEPRTEEPKTPKAAYNIISVLKPKVDPTFLSSDESMQAYPFQQDGIKFVEGTNYNACIADAMGLGKTIQANLIIKRNKKNLLPVLIIVPGSLKYQWVHQILDWNNETPLAAIPIASKETIIPGFQYYIISMDLIAKPTVIDRIKKLGIKFVIMDEAHKFKNLGTKRSDALVRLMQECNIQHKLMLTGTPIKNRANEYFMILNQLAPEHFPSLTRFQRRWLTPNEKGVYTRIAPYLIEEFNQTISRWVIRREKHEVLKNLPPLTRDYQFIEISDPFIKKSYNNQLDLFSNFLNSGRKLNMVDILGWLARIRNLTGSAKAKDAIEYSRDFLNSTDDSLCVGIHHTGVRDTLYEVFQDAGFSPLKFSGEDNAYRKNWVQNEFNAGHNRLLIINMLAGGVGLNLQSCSNALVLERQWNSADEEQFESRFHRDGQKKPVNCTYMIAKGTIDEWFHRMVIEKRRIFQESVGGNEFDLLQDEQSMMDLAQMTVTHKL